MGLGILAGSVVTEKAKRLRYAMSLFSGQEQYENFAQVTTLFPVSTVTASSEPFVWVEGPAITLPETFSSANGIQSTANFLSETDTVALMVLRDGQIRFERYWLTGSRDGVWPSWSVAKSFVSALIGIAVDEGLIEGINDPITTYLPALEKSGYAGVSIKDILQMSSGARWDEDYSRFNSDINRLGRVLALGGSLDKFVSSIDADLPPGTFNRYNSADTQVLGQLLVAVTGQSLTDYMQTRLWEPLGAQMNGYWLLDDKGMEMAFAGFHATARDYALLGELYRQNGRWRDRQIVPEAWVNASLAADAPHLLPGDNPASNNQFGYGYQWWLLGGDDNDFTAMGVYNQFVYVNPAKGTVIVKLSANSDFGVTDDQSSYRDQETIALFRAIANNLDKE